MRRESVARATVFPPSVTLRVALLGPSTGAPKYGFLNAAPAGRMPHRNFMPSTPAQGRGARAQRHARRPLVAAERAPTGVQRRAAAEAAHGDLGGRVGEARRRRDLQRHRLRAAAPRDRHREEQRDRRATNPRHPRPRMPARGRFDSGLDRACPHRGADAVAAGGLGEVEGASAARISAAVAAWSGSVATPRLAVRCAMTPGMREPVEAARAASRPPAARPRGRCRAAGRRTPRRPSGRRSRWRGRWCGASRPTLSSTSSPAWWPWRSLSALKWSRSTTIADSGEWVRWAWATMRISVSCTERALGRRVSGSVAARCSAIARLRRLASTGAAWADGGGDGVELGRLDAAGLEHEQRADHLAADERGHAQRRRRHVHSSQLCSGALPGSRS